ncbi:hypothetical protein SAMN05443245_5859 [Paraburkholderia fungorum]|uniref:Uncharacterized protein n=1 Tax=Paraburkholderia fungorum TaxID=134537 RepID=A0A1H1IXW1_9BURK|nr:hypothetical protein [Paraburkholderia fungorum]SDR42565.1 hypothetical protein SAMN05443245_5859 [Paraburkholderia fungorum]
MKVTLQDSLNVLRGMLDSVDNLLTDPQGEENEATRKVRHQIALMNLKRLADVARAAERDLADGLIHEPFLDSLGLRYRAVDREVS